MYKDGTFYVKPEMLKTSAILPFVWSEVTYRCLWKKALKFRQCYFKQ